MKMEKNNYNGLCIENSVVAMYEFQKKIFITMLLICCNRIVITYSTTSHNCYKSVVHLQQKLQRYCNETVANLL